MSIELNKESVEQADASSCQGTNCGTTTGDHSSECLAEAAAGQGWELKPGDLCGRDCPIHKISVKQAGGDERAAFEQIHTVPRGIMWSEEESQYVRVHEKHCPLRTWNSFVALWAGWQARAALAQPSPAQAEAERPEVVARVVHSNPVVLGQCGPLNANDELMTVAQHAASVARWAEMFNRVEQQRDAALVEVERLRESKGDPVGSFEKCMKVMYERDEHAKRLEVALARVAELEMLLRKLSTNGLMQFSTVDEEMAVQAALGGAPVAQAQQLHDLDKQCRDDVARALGLRPNQERGFAWSYLLASIKSFVKASEDSAQAQHSVPEGYALLPVRETEAMHDAVMALLYKGVDRTDTQKLLDAYIAAAPGKEGV
ncbi:hypothetical protein [Pseudomonas aeruginosa]|uniref:hypothetical protein n=1 Tax=Pseudomonas aeruginosa TaxID=287 RepID=UPI00159D793A|nr:hypothetical protein [Pseudomonas aeruginosa]